MINTAKEFVTTEEGKKIILQIAEIYKIQMNNYDKAKRLYNDLRADVFDSLSGTLELKNIIFVLCSLEAGKIYKNN